MEHSPKKASWLELLYDLVFVAIVAQMTYAMFEHHTSLADWISIILASYLIFLAWLGTTINRNIQNYEGHVDKIFIQLQMIFAFLMSLTIPEFFEGRVNGFLVSYALIRFLQTFLVLRSYRIRPGDAPKTKNIVQGMTVAASLALFATFVPMPYTYIVIAMVVLLEIFNPIAKGRGNTVRLLNMHHLQERLGLFLLLVMGESVLVVAIANTIADESYANPAIVLSGLIMIIAFWWTYFSHLEHLGIGKRTNNLFRYLHAHLFLYSSIVMIATAYKNLLHYSLLRDSDLYLLVGGVALFGITSYLIRGELDHREEGRTGGMISLVLTSLLAGFVIQKIGTASAAAVLMTLIVAVWAFIDEKRRFVWHNDDEVQQES